MTPVQIIFLLIALVTLIAAVLVVTLRNLIHAALCLIVALFGIAVVFAILNAGFLAVAQVVVYIGAIAILMIFAIMLTRRVSNDTGPQLNMNWMWAAAIAVIAGGGLIWMLKDWSGLTLTAPELERTFDPVRELGQALVSPSAYVLPFELASVLLLAALIGALLIAWDRKVK